MIQASETKTKHLEKIWSILHMLQEVAKGEMELLQEEMIRWIYK